MMNPTESIRLTRAELDTVLIACAYSLTAKTLDYNQSKMIALSLGRIPASLYLRGSVSRQWSICRIQSRGYPAMRNQNDENNDENNAESDGEQDQGEFTRQSLATALTKAHDKSKVVLDAFPETLAIGVGIQSKVIAAKSPTGIANLSFNSEECEFLTNALRTFDEAEVEPTKHAEIILSHMTRDYDGEMFIANSARQTKDERDAVQSRNDDFTCLMAKVITYGKSLIDAEQRRWKSLASGTTNASNDQ